MAFSLSGASDIALTWLRSGMFWVIIAIVLTFSALGLLWWWKRTKLKYNVLEIVNFGNGKVGISQSSAGVFKPKSALMGLWDYGEGVVYKLKDGRRILDATEDDLQDIMGKKGFILRRKDGDPKILVPVAKVKWENEKYLFEIAPADFRDSAVNILNEATRETQGWAEKYLPYIMLGGIVVFFVISMILASQFFNRTVDKASELLIKAGEQAQNIGASSAP